MAEASRRAWSAADLGRTCHLPFGSYPADVAAGINLFDLLVHCSDIALAVEVPMTGRAELWEIALVVARRVVSARDRDLEHYGPPRNAPPDAPAAARLRAYLGR